eukprot:CAMPEP_0117695564 /NCGR_PEP_ID=MMETSP0804-20121206/28203_1 /TAXON_ID=1074897 /ORGANISM="Tetraselmis astigmatica, Strain CCMP880" /LENGTH=179 /DNA_ID=CAMNT_0005509637 /DNA_START=547 /DNA_END=1087 /DNA_ORIENTATION=-
MLRVHLGMPWNTLHRGKLSYAAGPFGILILEHERPDAHVAEDPFPFWKTWMADRKRAESPNPLEDHIAMDHPDAIPFDSAVGDLSSSSVYDDGVFVDLLNYFRRNDVAWLSIMLLPKPKGGIWKTVMSSSTHSSAPIANLDWTFLDMAVEETSLVVNIMSPVSLSTASTVHFPSSTAPQ